MSHVALARKYRPKTFTELLGQDHVTKALTNSLTRNRLHHAYLFTGTRGVGKTSIARLFAKALNCESGVSATPCLTCDACLAIEQARYIDLIEIDAASKTRVEDTRELLENVTYAPTQGRFKVYLIDEVHMLSTHSFNALLKTLEEPPAHVVFLLATTEAEKLPMTVLSRCLQFHLNALSPEDIQKQLEFILTEEKITFDTQALALIAKAADGSVRDALSLLDQIIATAGNTIQEADVKKTLGHTQHDYALDILNALAHNQPESLLTLSQSIAKEGGQYAYVLNELLSALHQLTRLHILPEKTPLQALTQALTPEDTQLLYQIALKGQEELPLAPTRAIGFEMTLLRMHAFKPASTASTPPLSYQTPNPAPASKIKESPNANTITAPVAAPVVTPAPPPSTDNRDDSWDALIPKLKLTGLALNAAKQADLILQEDGTANLQFDKKHRPLFTAGVIQKIEQKLSDHYDKSVKLNLQSDSKTPNTPAEKQRAHKKAEQKAHQEILDADPAFQSLKETFASE
ncbi:MAG: DNA polymerase III subunit gamma/tau [Gammaproteobacteria bacterium]|nr:DNA polymerase III subunit gamma/tau [Gammaproteobacteria bacterium]